MKYQIMISMLFDLLGKDKLSSRYLAEKYNISERSVNRYLTEMSISGVPIDVQRGKNGGIAIPEEFKLKKCFFTPEESEALVRAIDEHHDDYEEPAFHSAVDKLKNHLLSS